MRWPFANCQDNHGITVDAAIIDPHRAWERRPVSNVDPMMVLWGCPGGRGGPSHIPFLQVSSRATRAIDERSRAELTSYFPKL